MVRNAVNNDHSYIPAPRWTSCQDHWSQKPIVLLVRQLRRAREATTVMIGIHPFVVGTPDGAAAMRRVLTRVKSDTSVWLTDTDAILKAINVK